MSNPKISVLIPMYNRKHYIEQCLDSALRQTFQDYEIIVRDDGSTDGSADFVAKRYADAISSGKLKLRRNEKNIGEFPTDNRLLREATGKYIMILHSDDMYLSQALEHMYGVAEHFNADVVHSSFHIITAPDGVIAKGKPLKIVPYDGKPANNVTVGSNDLLARFNEWNNHGIGIDAQHNIFRKEFLTDNDLWFESFGKDSLTGGNRLLALKWIMKAKVFIKTPMPFYIYRNSPDSITRGKFSSERVAKFISQQIELARHLEDFFASDDFFKDKSELQYLVRSHLFMAYDNHWINRLGVYKDGITPELHHAVEEAFKKYFGDDAALPTFLFHWIHVALFNKSANIILPPPPNHQ